jgi:predicted metal-binding membrane protein
MPMIERAAQPLPAGYRAARRRAWLEHHPEWWVLAASMLGWALMYHLGPASVAAICSAGSTGAAAITISGLPPVAPDPGAELTHWLVMSMAMMLPLSYPLLRYVAFHSYSWRRHRAVAVFAAGYLSIWALAGAVLIGLGAVATALGADNIQLTVCTLSVALAWQLTPLKAQALRRCHRTIPLSPVGLSADLDCLRLGLMSGGNCVVSCGPIMAALLFGLGGVLPMLAAQAIVLYERNECLPGHPRFLLMRLRRAAAAWLPRSRHRSAPTHPVPATR